MTMMLLPAGHHGMHFHFSHADALQHSPSRIVESLRVVEYSPIKVARVKLVGPADDSKEEGSDSFWFAFPDARVLEKTRQMAYPGGYWYDDLYEEKPDALVRGLCSRLCLELLLDASPCHRRNSFFLNIGANLGLFTVLAAAKGCHAIAVEGFKAHKAFIDISRDLNGFDITVIPAAAGDRFGEVAFGDGALARSAEGEVTTGTTPMVTADSVVDQHVNSVGGSLVGMMIDVEGFEQEVLLGAAQTIRTLAPAFVVVEVWPVRDGVNKTVFPGLDMLAENGYKLVAHPEGIIVPTVVSSALDPRLHLDCYPECGNGRCCLTEMVAVRHDVLPAVLRMDFLAGNGTRVGRRSRLGEYGAPLGAAHGG